MQQIDLIVIDFGEEHGEGLPLDQFSFQESCLFSLMDVFKKEVMKREKLEMASMRDTDYPLPLRETFDYKFLNRILKFKNFNP